MYFYAAKCGEEKYTPFFWGNAKKITLVLTQ